jgi:hypothetical protein
MYLLGFKLIIYYYLLFIWLLQYEKHILVSDWY